LFLVVICDKRISGGEATAIFFFFLLVVKNCNVITEPFERSTGGKIFALWLALTVVVVCQDNVQKCRLAKICFLMSLVIFVMLLRVAAIGCS
jgi:hypothetical protein